MGKQSWKAGNMLNPVPAVMVSVADQNHRPNIITVAWAGTVCTNPPMVSISVRPSRYSYEIIEKTGEFVINLTNEKLAKACDYCGVVSGRDVDKFKIYYSQVENLFLEKHFGLLYFVFAFIGVESTDTIELSIASNFISSFTCDFIISFSKLLSIS